jgi:hypothetical protein
MIFRVIIRPQAEDDLRAAYPLIQEDAPAVLFFIRVHSRLNLLLQLIQQIQSIQRREAVQVRIPQAVHDLL